MARRPGQVLCGCRYEAATARSTGGSGWPARRRTGGRGPRSGSIGKPTPTGRGGREVRERPAPCHPLRAAGGRSPAAGACVAALDSAPGSTRADDVAGAGDQIATSAAACTSLATMASSATGRYPTCRRSRTRCERQRCATLSTTCCTAAPDAPRPARRAACLGAHHTDGKTLANSSGAVAAVRSCITAIGDADV